MNKVNNLFSLLFIFGIASCSSKEIVSEPIFCFDTFATVYLYEGNEVNITDITKILQNESKLSDNYLSSDVTNVYKLNQTNEKAEVDPFLYELLRLSKNMYDLTEGLYNPLVGSLAKKWKESLAKKEVLSNDVIETELDKIDNSSLILYPDNFVQRNGDAEIDLGGIAKGYALDLVKDYFESKNMSHYMVDAGRSSILLGEKDSEDGYFSIGISDLPNKAYVKVKNTFLSTSSISEQGAEIDGKTYSHIVNPLTGDVNNLYDAVIITSNKGYVGDTLSTAFMMLDKKEFSCFEEGLDLQILAIKDKKIVYKSEGFEVYYH